MRTPSGILHVVDFKTSQIVSNIQPKNYWDDKRHWEIKNNIDTLEFKVFDNTDHAATLMQQNLVLKEVRDGRIVPYVITETEKNSDDRSIIAYTSGEWIQLAKAGIINPQKIEGKTVNEFIDMALVGTKWKRGKTEYAGFHTMTIDEFIDPLKFLKDIASLFELEIQYRAEVVGSQIVGRYVDMVKKRGRDTGKEVTLGKDLMGIKRIENSQNICTALLGFVKKEGGDFITISSINNGVPYLVDNDAFQRWNERGQHKFGCYTPETEEDIMPQRLLTLMKIEMAKRINTTYIYDVQAQSIGRVFGLAHELINEGDTIRIKDTGFTPKLYLEARAIAGDESFTDPTQDKYVFGDYREIIDPNEELRKLYNKVLASLGNKQEILDQLDELIKETAEQANNAQKESEAAKKLAEKVQDNLKNYQTTIIESKTAPTTGLEPGKTLWLDISNGKPGILKLWKNGIWDPVVPDVEKAKKETLEQVTKDINNTKQELDKKVETLKTETETLVNTQINEVQTTLNDKVAAVKKDTETISGEILNIKKDVSGKVDGEFVKNQIKDKVDKSGVFTKEEINNGFIGKQIYETDKQGNVKKFQEINTSVEQTNEAIKSKAEKQSVIDLGNNLTQVSKTANEAKQTADGNTRTISQVDSKVNQTATDFTKKTTAIEETVNGVSTKVTNIQTEQGKISERVTKSEQTAEGFKKSIESLNTANGTTSNRLNKVEETVDGTKQTISDIQAEAASLKKTTNEIKTTADGTKQALTELKTKVDNTVISVRNILLNTDNVLTGVNTTPTVSVSKSFKLTADAPLLLRGKSFTISLKAKSKGVSKGAEKPYAGLELIVKYKDGETAWLGIRAETTLPADSDWKSYNFTHQMKDKEIESITANSLIRDLKGTVELKEWKVEVGTVATEYSPAPEDQVTTTDFTKKTVEIETTIKGINTTVSNVQNEQGKLTERVTKSEQTADGFKTSIESLTKKDSDISNKLNTVESTVEGTKKTISDVQQTTNDLKKTTTEITEKAGKISEKLESVEKKFDDIKIGGQNFYKQKSFGAAGGTSITYDDSNKWWNITIPAGSSGSWKGILYNNKNATLLVGRTYTISYEIYADEVIPTAMDINNFGVTTVTGTNDNDVVAKRIMRTPKTIAGQWVKVSATFIMPDNITQDFYDNSVLGVGGGWTPTKITNIKIRNMQLEEGNIPTSYRTPSEDQVSTDEFNKKTTDIEKSVDGVKTTVTNVQNSQTGFEKRMTTVEQTASGLSSTVSNLNNVVSDQGKKLTDANSKIEQQAKEIGAKVAIKQVEDYVAGFKIPDLKNTVNKNKEDLLAELANKLATEQYNQKMTQIDNRFVVNEQGIGLAAKKTEVYTQTQSDGRYAKDTYVKEMEGRIQVTEKNILSTVKNGDIISAINQTAEKITIDVAKLNINADTMVKWLTAKGIDTNLIRINGDKITIDKNGVTVKMLDFLFEDEWGTKTTAVSRRNLIADPDFSSVGKKNIGHADYYGFEGGYGLSWKSQGNVVIEKNTSVFDYEQMVNAARVDMYNYPEAVVNNGIHPGNEYTVSAHFRTSMINGVRKTAKPRLHVCCVKFRDNVSYDIWNEQKMDFPEPSTFYGEIRRYSYTFKVPTNYKPQEHALIIKVCSANGQITGAQTAICVSGVTLYSGKYASMYNWDRAAAERAAGLQPFNAIAVGSVNNNIGPAPDGQTFDISTEKDVKFFTNIRAVQGVNLGGNAFQGWGHIRFTDGNLGPGFYVSSANGWKFNALG
ncbi:MULTISPECIES: phage tail spike protein [Bacillus cereus group]|uniref:Phage minor structural protein n=1 Tax=Bacillus cereus VD021 TaxID=1053224 RepID=R8HZK7_BACCE|nr:MULTISPECIES: phage tail spike protein [Bacillus cereus group]EOO78353.1 phage minor structural protein [Bacillus cereus VD021]